MRILVVRNDRMGDLLMSLPAVHELRKAFPRAEIFLLIREGLEPLLEHHPNVDRLLSWDQKQGTGWFQMMRWGRLLRRFRFDTALILNPTRFFHVATFLAGIPVRVGYGRKWGFLLTAHRPDDKAKRLQHEVQYNLELLHRMGISTGEPLLSLPLPKAFEEEARELLESHGVIPSSRWLIGLHPWTSDPTKSWPIDSFHQLADCLQKGGFSIVVIGETRLPKNPIFKKEATLSRPFDWPHRLAWPGEGDRPTLVNLMNQVPLRLLPALLRKCAAVVSNDSGPVHVAAAVGTPVVVVAPRSHGPDLTRWRPLGKKHRLLLAPTVEEVAAVVREVTAHAEIAG